MKTGPVSRRRFLKGAFITGGVLVAGGAIRQIHNVLGRNLQPRRARAYRTSLQPAADLQALPNIIIILCDDLGLGDLASPLINATNLKVMATEGVILTNFYASASVCSPSRAGLLTGRYPVRTLISMPLLSTHNPLNIVMDITGRYSYDVQGIPEDEVLLPEIFQLTGYHTGLVGKWHLGGTPGYLPNDRGFEFFYGALWSYDDQPYAIYRNRQVELPAPANQDLLTHNFTLEAVNFIQNNRTHPFFLYLAHAMPHYPEHASADFQGSSGAGLYGDAVQEIDWGMGQIFTTLKQLGLDENTLVIFTSDNGPWMQGNPGYQRGRKLLWFEGGFHVPFIVRWPSVIPAGSTNAGMAVNFDLFTTCLLIAGVDLPEDRIIDGLDILPLLKGDAPSPHDNYVYYDVRTPVAIRNGRWKYVRQHMTDISSYWPTQQGPFLFDLDADPNESYSLIESNPVQASESAALLDNFEKEMSANLRGWL